MSIPASYFVDVLPSVIGAAGSAIDLNGVMLTRNTYVPIGAVQQFATADDVGKFFGPLSDEKAKADVYFNGPDNKTKTPGRLYFVQYPSANVAAYLRGGSMASVTLATLKTYTGTLTIVADGVSKTSSSISLTSATSFSNAATIITAAFTSPGFAVTYDATQQAFVVTSSTTGADSKMQVATGTIAASLKLTTATGAVTSQGAIAGVPATNMDAIKAVTLNWATFTTLWEPDLTEKQAFSDWANAQNERYCYVGWDTDITAATSGGSGTWGAYLKAGNLAGSLPIYGLAVHAAFAMGWAAALDFDRLNGSQTLAYKHQSGLLPYVTDATTAQALEDNGYNFYGASATAKDNFVFMFPGSVSGSWLWAQPFFNQIWLNANFQLSMLTLLMNVNSAPYNTDGYTLVEASLLDPVNKGVNFGAIRKGVNLSASQKAQIQNILGVDASPAIYAKGWYLQIVDATADIRVERRSPSMTFVYTDGGSIHRLNLASIAVL